MSGKALDASRLEQPLRALPAGLTVIVLMQLYRYFRG